MNGSHASNRITRLIAGRAFALSALGAMAVGLTASAQTFTPGNLVVSRSVYTGTPSP